MSHRRSRAFALVTAAAVVAALSGCGGGTGQGYRVDVIFDSAKGLLAGQLVKVAGARSGEIVAVRLTPDFKARIQLRVDRAFAPFRTDARCTIQPEGLIGENFVQCDPGRTGSALQPSGGAAPTVPVTRTSAPVSFPDLFNLATVPVRQRLSVLIDEIGIGVAGRGEQLNDVLRRANPTLNDVQHLGEILERQRSQISTALVTSDQVVAELARRRGTVADLVRRTGRVTSQTAQHRAELASVVRRLPPMLKATRGSTRRLGAVIQQATPLLGDLHAAAPGLRRLITAVAPLSRAATPALRDVGAMSVTAGRAARRAGPTVRLLRRFAARALPVGTALDSTLRDLRDRGVIENVLLGFYRAAVANARYDKFSHAIALRVMINDCTLLAVKPTAGCNANYTQPNPTRRAAPAPPEPAESRPPAHPPQLQPRPPFAGPPATPPPAAPAPSTPKPAPVLPALPQTGVDALDALLDKLGAGAPPPKAASGVTSLLDYLLG